MRQACDDPLSYGWFSLMCGLGGTAGFRGAGWRTGAAGCRLGADDPNAAAARAAFG